jgi:hypothetical protein
MSEITYSSKTKPKIFPSLWFWFVRDVDCDAAGVWKVERLSASAGSFSHNISYTRLSDAEDVLALNFWDKLTDYLPVSLGDGVMTANDFVHEVPSAILHGLRVTAHAAVRGKQRVMIAFKHFLGSFNSLFRENKTPNLLSDSECGLSLRTITDVVLPALNLSLPQLSTESVNGASREALIENSIMQMRQNRNEIEFYCALLCRFVRAEDNHKHGLEPDPVFEPRLPPPCLS